MKSNKLFTKNKARIFSSIVIFSILISGCAKDQNDPTPVGSTDIEGYSLIWQDEFDQDAINLADWNYETGDGTDYGLPKGWGNSELQIYTTDPSNAYLSDDNGNSVLVITAKEDGQGGYTSAKLTTQNKVSARFGKVTTRIKLPETQGIWPAFWMLGTNFDVMDWPGCGEIDILELVGNLPEKTLHTVHFTNGENSWEYNSKDYTLSTGKFSDDYHIFTLDWTPEEMIFFVDGQEAQRVAIEADMKEFLRSFYFILNIAVGGTLPGNPDGSTLLPQSMFVDYIRYYEKNGFTPPAAPALDVAEETLGVLVDDELSVHAILDNYTDFGPVKINSYGAGGEPDVIDTTDAQNGDKSLAFQYPGTNWGGAFFEMDNEIDFSGKQNGSLIFSIKKPADFFDAEVKLESTGQSSAAAVFLKNYSAEDIGNGWSTYSIPMTDFAGLDLNKMRIPFSLWNPTNNSGDYFSGTVLIDGIHIIE